MRRICDILGWLHWKKEGDRETAIDNVVALWPEWMIVNSKVHSLLLVLNGSSKGQLCTKTHQRIRLILRGYFGSAPEGHSRFSHTATPPFPRESVWRFRPSPLCLRSRELRNWFRVRIPLIIATQSKIISPSSWVSLVSFEGLVCLARWWILLLLWWLSGSSVNKWSGLGDEEEAWEFVMEWNSLSLLRLIKVDGAYRKYSLPLYYFLYVGD